MPTRHAPQALHLVLRRERTGCGDMVRRATRGRRVALVGLALHLTLIVAAAGPARAAEPARPAPPAALAGTAANAAPHAVVLMYHRFGEDRYPSTSIRLSQFEGHLRALRDGGYTVLPLRQIVEALRAGAPLPPRSVGISVDDAYASVHREAWPRLRAAGYPFTLFVSTDALDRGYGGMLTWDELREMVRGGGVDVGNHTASHPHLADRDGAFAEREIDRAQQRLREELGSAPVLFAYPYGEHGAAARAAVAARNFLAAFGQQSGAIGPQGDLMNLPRFALNESYGEPARFAVVAGALPLAAHDVTPADGLLAPGDNPPRLSFRVAAEAGGLERLACYLTGGGKLTLRVSAGRRVTVDVPQPLAPGRSRINCTLPAPSGAWQWFGLQYYVPGPAVR
ncbi:MAG: polysaccharide deacetylase family protein [Candidatus Lambdaproteobacteria bacterium]|nr:polysaccharide deacetylase family protein [Candidatus Lambdaproteobacteria bacterium]